MTDLRKLAKKHASKVEPSAQKVVAAIVLGALKELSTRVVLDVTQSDPKTAVVADRIVRARAIPYPHGNYQGARIQARIEYKDIIIYAIEAGRELERRAQSKGESA